MKRPEKAPQGITTKLDPDTVSKLLRLGLTSPVDGIARRLRRAGGEDWILSALRHIPSLADADIEAVFLQAGTPLERIRSVKDECKKLFHEAADAEMKDVAMTGYFLSLAAALAHHGELITGQPGEEVRQVLIDLEEAMEGPWRELVLNGASAIGST